MKEFVALSRMAVDDRILCFCPTVSGYAIVKADERLKAMSHQLAIELPVEIPVEEARLLLIARLFELGRLSLGQASELAGYSKPTFMELLGKMGIAVFGYPTDELEKELSL